MDIGRRPYKTACRFLRDSGTVSTIRWIEARADAPTLPFDSAIVSLDLENDEWAPMPVGEVVGAPRPFTGQRAPVGLNGARYCGSPADFQEGGEYLPDLPPAPYDVLGFLACCQVAIPPPPPPMPGPTCDTALEASIGVTHAGTIPAFSLVEQWWKVTIPGTGWLMTTTGGIGTTSHVNASDAVLSCASLPPFATTIIGGSIAGIGAPTHTVYIFFNQTFAAFIDVPYTFTLMPL